MRSFVNSFVRSFVRSLVRLLALHACSLALRMLEKARSKEGLKVGTQPLLFAGKPLDDDEATAADIGLEWDSQLQLPPINVTAKLPRVRADRKKGVEAMTAKTLAFTVAMGDPLSGARLAGQAEN